MTTLQLEIPDSAFPALRCSPREFIQELRLAAAIHWYQKGLLSQERAAEIAGLDRTDFLLTLAQEQIDVFVVDLEDLQRELAST